MAFKEPFQSLQDKTDFDSNVELARKWLMDFVCSLGYEQSAVTVELPPDLPTTLRLTVADPARDKAYDPFYFSRTQIEGIALGDKSIMTEASDRIQSTVPRRV